MKNTKKSKVEPCRDRLSDLPNSIIYEIFGLLQMRDVVRTTILSKRWNNLWTTTPYLYFDSNRDSMKFINQALTWWKGLKIQKFKIGLDYKLEKKSDLWVPLPMDRGVEELCLENISDEGVYPVPRNLYSCTLLKVLSLYRFELENHGIINVQWNQLRSLTMKRCIVDEDLLNQVVCASPHLEVLILDFLYTSGNHLNIRSSSLKKLSIGRVFKCDDLELRIWAPNLETLDFKEDPYDKYSLTNVSSLTQLTLDLVVRAVLCEDTYKEIVWQIFPTIQHVEKVTLSDWCIKVLHGYMKDKYSTSPWLNLKSLTINKVYTGGYERIVDILQIFPELKTLVLKLEWSSFFPANHVGSFFHYERNLPESFLLQLRTVEITLTKLVDNSIYPFVEILLKHASKLQKMTIRVGGISKPPSTALFLEQKLLTMPRSSPTAELIFAEY